MNRSDFFSQFEPQKLFPVATVGLIAGAIDLPLIISFAILIYSGDLSSYAATGIGLMLFGGLLMQLIIVMGSSTPGMVGGPQDSPAAIMALTALAIAAKMTSASANARFATVVMTIILTTVISGLFFIIIGGFKLSRFIRFIPYPVVGGFIAGTGLLLVQGALGVMLGKTPGMANLGILLQREDLIRWVPGVVFGILLLVASRRFQHFLVAPIMLTATTAVFYILVWIRGLSMAEIRGMGWVLGPFPQGALWDPPALSLLAHADWGLIVGQASNIAAAIVISAVSLLLNASALELIAKKDVDLNRELIAAGFANLAGGVAGCSVGYQYLGLSALSFRMNIHNRLAGLFAALVTVMALLFGASLLSLIPTFIVGGLLFFVGLSFLVEWLYDAWFQLPRIDYFLVLLILGIVGAVGFLEGVGTGIVIAVILFVVNYSRINITKDVLSGQTYQSNMERPNEHRELIQRRGRQIYILRLQGFIFFGTAQNLLNRVRERLADHNQEKLKYLVLDFQNMTALDSSAVFSFIRLKQMAEANRFYLVLTELNNDSKTKLGRGGLVEEQDKQIRIFSNLDYGMEWCESKLLADEGTSTIIRAASLKAQMGKVFPSPDLLENFLKYLEREEIKEYHTLINRGDPPDAMYFVDSGEVTARLEVSPGKFIRLKSMGAGTIVGEVGLYLKQIRTATVVASMPSVVYRLSAGALQEMEQNNPELAARLHHWIARVLSERLAETNRTLEVLLG